MLKSLQEISFAYWAEYKKGAPNLPSFCQDIPSQEALWRLDRVVYEMLSLLFTGEQMRVSYIHPCKSCEFDTHSGVNRVKQPKYSQLVFTNNARKLKKLLRILKVMEIVQRLLTNGDKINKREVFYRHPGLFTTQAVSDNTIELLACILQVPRNRLNIRSAGKGLLAGSLAFYENESYTTVGNRICKIPPDLDSVPYIETDAEFVLVIEKDTVLSRLVDEEYFRTVKCIGVTGCGYPDMPTREFLRRVIAERPQLPVLVLTDLDPHGFQILCTYTFGSAAKATECDLLAIPTAHWLGLHCDESQSSSLPLTAKDLRMLEQLLARPQFNVVSSNYHCRRFILWRESIRNMMQTQCKFELESVLAGSTMSDYISRKIANGSWL